MKKKLENILNKVKKLQKPTDSKMYGINSLMRDIFIKCIPGGNPVRPPVIPPVVDPDPEPPYEGIKMSSGDNVSLTMYSLARGTNTKDIVLDGPTSIGSDLNQVGSEARITIHDYVRWKVNFSGGFVEVSSLDGESFNPIDVSAYIYGDNDSQPVGETQPRFPGKWANILLGRVSGTLDIKNTFKFDRDLSFDANPVSTLEDKEDSGKLTNLSFNVSPEKIDYGLDITLNRFQMLMETIDLGWQGWWNIYEAVGSRFSGRYIKGHAPDTRKFVSLKLTTLPENIGTADNGYYLNYRKTNIKILDIKSNLVMEYSDWAELTVKDGDGNFELHGRTDINGHDKPLGGLFHIEYTDLDSIIPDGNYIDNVIPYYIDDSIELSSFLVKDGRVVLSFKVLRETNIHYLPSFEIDYYVPEIQLNG